MESKSLFFFVAHVDFFVCDAFFVESYKKLAHYLTNSHKTTGAQKFSITNAKAEKHVFFWCYLTATIRSTLSVGNSFLLRILPL